MPVAPVAIPSDPLERILYGQGRMPSPLPLLTTSYDVTIRGGLARVIERRTFRNSEASSIEATITFPVPVHAVVYGLELHIGERRLKAKCEKRKQAREHYEDAIEQGKTAVLHEELLRGVHMLSVGHLPPGESIVVASEWVVSLGWMAGRAQLRIPATVGDVYGQSPLSDADDLVSGGSHLHGTLNVRCEGGHACVGRLKVREGEFEIPLDRPIDITVRDWCPVPLQSRTVDGRQISLDIAPAPDVDADINAAVLVDRSGSMADAMSARRSGTTTKFDAIIRGLKKAGKCLTDDTAIDLWQFDHRCDLVGAVHSRKSLEKAIKCLDQPGGGTEIGGAVECAIQGSRKPDLLVITDGKSYVLDVQKLAAHGRRISVVLVGEDSLEANIGHLAAVTGGEIFVALGKNVAAVVGAALQALQRPRLKGTPSDAEHVVQYRAGMTLAVVWSEKRNKPVVDDEDNFARAISAFATAMMMPQCNSERAAALAEREGILCHLTSLIIVDEAGARQHELPATRKIPLMAPAARARPASPRFASERAATTMLSSGRMKSQVASSARRESYSAHDEQVNFSMAYETGDGPEEISSDRPELDTWLFRLRDLLERDGDGTWCSDPDKVLAGDLSLLPVDFSEKVRRAAENGAIKDLAKQLKLAPEIMIIGFLAVEFRDKDRAAKRLAKRIFGRLTADPMRILNEVLAERGHNGYPMPRDADVERRRDAKV